MSKVAVVFIFLSLSISLSTPALGQKKKAKVLFDKGVSALEQRKFKSALSSFEEAYELSPHWAVLAHIGTCHANLNHPIKAINALEQFLVDGGNNIPDDERETAEEIIRLQRRKVGVLVLSVEDEGVEALVDGESIGLSPFDEKLLIPGTHEVAVVFAEDDIVKRNFDIGAGQEYLLRIEREQHVAAPPPPPPPVSEKSEPEPLSPDENEEMALPAFSAPPMETVEKRGSLTPFYVALGFTVASAVVTGVGWGFYVHYALSESNYADYLETITTTVPRFEGFTWEDTCTEKKHTDEAVVHYCNREASRRDFAELADRWFIVGIAASGATVVSGTLAIVFYALRHKFGNDDSSSAALHISPFLSPRESGLSVNVRF